MQGVDSMSNVSEVNSDIWEKEVLKSEGLVVVDFWHEQCPWCIRLAPIFNEVAEENKGKAKFATLNVFSSPENQHIALHLGVMSTPTLIFFCQGKPLAAAVGFKTKDRIKQLVENTLKNYKECARKSTELKIT
jgi:thioredoxin 1